jgi:hypothetical protein
MAEGRKQAGYGISIGMRGCLLAWEPIISTNSSLDSYRARIPVLSVVDGRKLTSTNGNCIFMSLAFSAL